MDSLPSMYVPELAGFNFQAEIRGTLKGELQNAISSSDFAIRNFTHDNLSAELLQGKITAKLRDKILSGNADLAIDDIELSGYPIDNISISGAYHPDRINADLVIMQSDSLSLSTDITFMPGELNNLLLSEFQFNLFGYKWQNENDSLEITFGKNYYQIENLCLENEGQKLKAQGFVNLEGDNDIFIEVDNFDVGLFNKFMTDNQRLAGDINLSVNLTGTWQKPHIKSDFSIGQVNYNDLAINKLHGNLDASSEQIDLNVQIEPTKYDTLMITGTIPCKLDFDNRIISLEKTKQFSLNIISNPIDLTRLRSVWEPVKHASGEFKLQMKAFNTLENPQLDSRIEMKNTKLKIPSLGINYKKMNLLLETNKNTINLENFSIQTGVRKKTGFLKIKGTTIFDFAKRRFNNINFNFEAEKWAALNMKNLNLNLDSKLTLTGNSDSPKLEGNIVINNAKYSIPESSQSKFTSSKPLLLSAKTIKDDEILEEQEQDFQSLRFFDNWQSDVHISFPRNTWIRSKDMNLEITGEVRALKNNEDLALFGNVGLRKGSYKLYGKKFELTNGNVILEGESETDFNPTIDISARHLLIGKSGNKNILMVNISGKLRSPIIQFTYNDAHITEADGFSYLVFGKSLDELSYGEKKQIDQTSGKKMAIKLFADQLIARVTNSIQSELELDVMEIKGSDNGSQASLMVGKYLTNELFISYQNEFSFGRSRNVAPQQITLDYELKKNFSLEAVSGSGKTTGLNLVWKYQK
jgi:autotransporter translocation and assembly factor TamB